MIYSIQILRGVAAVLVMLYHYSVYLTTAFPGMDIGFILFAGGYAGVDIFFVISGFVIVHSTERREHANPLDFSIRRLFRVVPLAQIATLVCFLIVAARPTSRLLWQSLLFVPRADFDPPKFGFPVVHQEWTLSYELFFYAIFAVVLVFTQRHRATAAAIAIVASVIGFQWALGGPISLYPDGVYLPAKGGGLVPPELMGELGNPIMLEFALGMALAAAYRRLEGWLRTERRFLAERLIGLSLIAVFLRSYFSPSDPGNGLLNKGAGAACLVVGGLLLEVSSRRPSTTALGKGFVSFLLWLGTISYSLYLVHLGISDRILRFLFRHLLGRQVEGVGGFFALIAMSLLLASAAYIVLERNLIRAGKYLVECRRKLAG